MNQVGLREHLKQGWFWIQVGGWKSIQLKHRWDFISIANNHVYSQQQLRGGSALDEGSGGCGWGIPRHCHLARWQAEIVE